MIWQTIPILPHYEASHTGLIRHKTKRHIRRPQVIPNGYAVIRAYYKRKFSNFYIHRLVASAFYGFCKHKEVNHRNGIKTDNRASNLEWVMRKENLRHSYIQNPHQHRGTKNSQCKLTITQVKEIKRRLINKETQKSIYTSMNIGRGTVNAIALGLTWSYI